MEPTLGSKQHDQDGGRENSNGECEDGKKVDISSSTRNVEMFVMEEVDIYQIFENSHKSESQLPCAL